MSRHSQGEGTIYQRADGRWTGALYVTTTDNKRTRTYVYGKTRAEVHEKLTERIRAERRGIRTPHQRWTVGGYVTYYLETIARPKLRPGTLEDYRAIARNHLLPAIGSADLRTLSVSQVQAMLNRQEAAGVSVRTRQAIRSFLRSVLSQAEREEIVLRNVAKLVQLPPWHRKPIRPWTPDEAIQFLAAAQSHRWHGAYLMALLYGMRRGEVLGLTWEHVDLQAGVFEVFGQLQRIEGHLQLTPVKTAASNRTLPILPSLARILETLPRGTATGSAFVFTSSTGTPIDPKNFVRSFHEIREAAGLRPITFHHTRHTTATLLKRLGVPDRDIQTILGHTHVSTTQQLYQHGDVAVQRAGLRRLEQALVTEPVAVKTAVNDDISTGQGAENGALTSGGPGGARTLDTLLKRIARALDEATLTSVRQRLQTRAHMAKFGGVAVKNCCHFASEPSRTSQHQLDVEAIEHLIFCKLGTTTFPYNLISHD